MKIGNYDMKKIECTIDCYKFSLFNKIYFLDLYLTQFLNVSAKVFFHCMKNTLQEHAFPKCNVYLYARNTYVETKVRKAHQ